MNQVNIEELEELWLTAHISGEGILVTTDTAKRKLISTVIENFPALLHELRVRREACERYEGMEETVRAVTIEGEPSIWNDGEGWRTQRNTISAWIKEQMGEGE